MKFSGQSDYKKRYRKNDVNKKTDYHMDDSFEMHVEKDTVVLKKAIKKCVLCNSAEEVISFKEEHICNNCIRRLKNNMF